MGISGVNWNTQIMPIAGSSTTEAVVIEAYGYALEMRAIYNETAGDSGAFVVATNTSFGINYGNPSEYPIWCSIFDSLGNYGIISCAATANIDINVDNEGDIPTSCGSDWLISVTNTTNSDKRNIGSAYGLKSIDLGAPGTDILSTSIGGTFDKKSGTSMSSPFVASSIALLFSSASSELINAYKKDPKNISLIFKDFILSGIDSVLDLQDLTVTGGRLNLHNSVQLVKSFPDSADPNPPQELIAYSDYKSPNSIELQWKNPTQYIGGDTLLAQEFRILVKRDGVLIDSVDNGIERFLDIGLTDGKYYGYEILSKIIETDSSSIGLMSGWTSGGAPEPSPPKKFFLTMDNEDQLKAHWINPLENIDGTPIDDFAGINLHQDGQLIKTFIRSSLDTGLVDSANFISMEGTHYYYLTAIDNENPTFESNVSNIGYTPIRIPFIDEFILQGDPSHASWLNKGADVSDKGVNPPSPPNVLTLDGYPSGTDTLTLLPTDLGVLKDSNYVFSYWYQPQGIGDSPEASDSLLIEFKDSTGSWIPISSHSGTTIFPFKREIFYLDSIDSSIANGIFYRNFQLRFRTVGSGRTNSHLDLWHLDDIYLGKSEANPSLYFQPKFFELTLFQGLNDALSFTVKNNQIAPSVLTISFAEFPESDWLQIPVDSVQLQSREELILPVLIDTDQLEVGIYHSKLLISSNDNLNPVDTISINLTVREILKIEIIPDTLSFDTLYVGQTLTEKIEIKNTTLDTLELSEILSTNSIFSVDTSHLFLAPLDSFELGVSFSPLQAEEYHGWLLISGIAGEGILDSIFLSGVGIYPPAVEINPSRIIYSLSEGDSADIPLRISNIGGSDLEWLAELSTEGRAVLMSDSMLFPKFIKLLLPNSGVVSSGEETDLVVRLYGVTSALDTQRTSIKIITNDPMHPEIGIDVSLEVISGLRESVGLPVSWDLFQNYPNPFNPETQIKFQLPKSSEVRIVIYDILGQRVRVLLNKRMVGGYYRVTWDGRDDSGDRVSSGLYLYRFEGDGFAKIRKMIIMR
jgi:hypothetical protein